jgi:hypothetical protein
MNSNAKALAFEFTGDIIGEIRALAENEQGRKP